MPTARRSARASTSRSATAARPQPRSRTRAPYEGQAFSLNVSSHFTAPAAGDSLTFSGALPAGLSIDAHTGVISGVPTDGDFGNNTITVTATDAHGKAISESFQLQVGDSGPTATAIANQSAYEGKAFSLNVSSHFTAPAAGDTLTFSGAIAGWPQHRCPYRRHLRRADRQRFRQQPDHGDGDRRPRQGDQRELPPPVGDSGPTATAIANQSAYEGQAFSLNVSSHFTAPAAGDSLTFSGCIAGWPQHRCPYRRHLRRADRRRFRQQSDHGDGDRRPWQGDQRELPASASATAARPRPRSRDQSAYEGKAFSLNVSSHFAAPAAGDTLTFSGALPAGLSIDAHTGIISGVPTDSDFGNNPITVTATDAHGKAISESFQLPGRRQRPDRNRDRKPERL